MSKTEFKPNPQQKQAIEIDGGPVLVVAGAGTGKTSVITERIARLIKDGTDPTSIVALTFTQKAAQEMEDRVNELRGGYNFDLKVMTYNAYGEQIIRRFAPDIGLNSGLKLLEEPSQLVFLREHLDKLLLDYYAPLTNPDGHISDLIKYFSDLKQNVVRPADYDEFIETLPAGTKAEKFEKTRHQELSSAFSKYIDVCRQYNVIDYDDQLYLALELFAARPNVLAKVQSEVEFLLVDEFQDTNAMQSDFLDAVCARTKNIMVVGDDDQSIYGWRGATLENILSFKDRYPKAKEVVLTKNYRSGQAILDASYGLIRNNDPHRLEAKHGFDKKLEAGFPGKPPKLEYFATHSDELEFISSDIKRRIKSGQKPGSIAVLARSHTTLARIHDYFDSSGIDHNLAGMAHDLYLQPVISDLIFVLRAVADPTDNSGVYQALISFLFDDVGPGQLSQISARADRQHLVLLDLAKDSGDEKLSSAAKLIADWHESSGSRPVSQTLYEIFANNVEPWLNTLTASEGGEAQALKHTRDIKELFDIMRDFERIATRSTVRGFMENVETLKAAGQNVADDSYLLTDDAVNVLTIHKAKGLEWDTVYVVNLIQSTFPGSQRGSNGMELPETLRRNDPAADDYLLEERRLMYVAMTRAANELIITSAERLRHGGSRSQPSIFLSEIFADIELAPRREEKTLTEGILLPRQTVLPSARLPSSMIKGEQLVLSASQIETYAFCPLNFYYKYILNWPEEPSKEAAIGQIMHEAAATINKGFLSGQPFTEEQTERMLDDSWPKEGFASPAERKKSLAKSKRIAKDYLKREKNSPRHPDLIEENFSFVLDGGKVRVNGRFDAAYSGQPTEVRDYKTGHVEDQETADKRAYKSYQLGIYGLAWQERTGDIPEELTLDFISSGFIGKGAWSERRIANVKSKIREIAGNIKSGRFPPKGRHDICLHPPLDQ